MKIAILGGGVAGLAVAVALSHRAGVADVRIHERESAGTLPMKAGHGLLLMQNGAKAMRALDAGRVLDRCTPIRRALVQSDTGATLDAADLDEVFCVTRAAIVEVLRAGLPDGALGLERAVSRVELGGTSGNRVHAVHFERGHVLREQDFDFIIGAEGVRSPLCQALNPGFARPASRVREIVTSTVLPDLARQLSGTFVKTMFMDRGLAFGLLAPTAERVIGFLQFDSRRHEPPAREASAADLRAFVVGRLRGAPEIVRAYLERCDFGSAHVWHPADADLPGRLAADNAVLIGDAAHPLLPFTSQGVGAALEDAIMLADRVAGLEGDTSRLPEMLAKHAADRRAAAETYIRGGRAILSRFTGEAGDTGKPYLDGLMSPIETYVALTRDDIAALFRIADRDGDGYLSASELDAAIDLFEPDIAAAERPALLAEMDRDRDGRLSPAEVLDGIGGTGAASSPLQRLRSARSPLRAAIYQRRSRVQDLLRLLSGGPDAGLDLSEFALASAMAGAVLPAADLEARFRSLDANGDGRLSLGELAAGLVVSALPVEATREGGPPAASLFADERVDGAALRRRAYNYRWATLPDGVIPLTAADPDFPPAAEITAAIQSYVAAGPLSYGPAEGLPEFRACVARHLGERRAVVCGPEQVMATNSAASALYLAVAALLGPGDEALIADPCDFLFERSVAAAGGTVRRFRLDEAGGWSFEAREIEQLIGPRTRLLMVCNPHNPSGRVWRRHELEAMAGIALRHDLTIVSDEVWSDIAFAPHTFIPMAALGPEVAARTYTVYGFSKGYALAGLRLGTIIAPDAGALARIVATSHADETAYGVSTVSQIAGIASLDRAQEWRGAFVAHLADQRDHAVARLNAMPGVRCAVPEGTFLVFPDVSRIGRAPEVIAERLVQDHGVAVVPGSSRFFGPGADGHIRLSLATSRAVLASGLDRLAVGLAAIARG